LYQPREKNDEMITYFSISSVPSNHTTTKRNIMGNGLRKAIEVDNWEEVRAMLRDDSVKSRIRCKTYTIQRYMGAKSAENSNDEKVKCLHMLLCRRVPIDVVATVIDIDRDQLFSLSQPNEESPLHFALMHPRRAPPIEVLEMLVRQHSEALEIQSISTGRTPLHIACASMQDVPVIKLLVNKNPNTIFIRDSSGCSPWDLVQQNSTGLLRVFYRWKLRNVLDPLWWARSERNLLAEMHDDEEAIAPSPPLSRDQKAQAGLCVLCWDGVAECTLIPCGHICLCQRCSEKHICSLEHVCPVCKAFFERPMRTFPAGIQFTADDME
jgi:hypothetical protein